MTLVVVYKTKKDLKAAVGQELHYIETSMFGNEYKADGRFTVANRPHITHMGREFFAEVTMEKGRIKKVT